MSKLIKQIASIALLAILLFFLLLAVSRGQSVSEVVATGGSFTLEKTVVAGGGKEKQFSGLSENGTAGQSVAGHRSQAERYTIYSGFWTPPDSAATAAPVEISGRVTNYNGRGIQNVTVILTSQKGSLITVRTGSFGYYRFSGVEAGNAYTVTVAAKRYTFADPTRIVNVSDNIADLNFVALELQ
jgi:hypothetical protein